MDILGQPEERLKTEQKQANLRIHKSAKNAILKISPTNLTGGNPKWHFKANSGTSPHITTGTRNEAKKRLF